VKQLVERGRINAQESRLFVDQFFVHHIDGDLDRGGRCALAGAGLQHPELLVLNGEFNVLHFFIMLFQFGVNLYQIRVGGGHVFFQRRIFCGPFLFGDVVVFGPAQGAFFGDLLRGADAGDDVFALRVDQVFAVKPFFAGGRVAREGDARGAAFAAVSENHGLDVDGGAPVVVKAVHLAVQDGARRVPGHEDRADGAPELLFGIRRKFLAQFFRDELLVAGNQLLQITDRHVQIGFDAFFVLEGVHDFLEGVVRVLVFRFEAHDDVAVHLDEAAVGIPAEPFVAGLADDALDRLIVQAQVQNRIHHAGHGHAGAGADGKQKGIGRIAKGRVHRFFNFLKRCFHFFVQAGGELFVVFVEFHTNIRRDCESRRNGNSQIRHFGQVCALAAEKVFHVGPAFIDALPESVNTFSHIFISFRKNLLN